MENLNGKELLEKLSYKRTNYYEVSSAEQIKEIYDYNEGYKVYLDKCKTEREATAYSIAMAEKNGYTEYKLGDALKAGDKRYLNVGGKSLFVFRVGTRISQSAVSEFLHPTLILPELILSRFLFMRIPIWASSRLTITVELRSISGRLFLLHFTALLSRLTERR